MSFLEQKYIHLVSSRFSKFVKKSATLYNLRCPYCLDSQKNKNKARGYLYEKKGNFRYHCHNCGESRRFESFLKDVDLLLYDDFKLEKLKESNHKHNRNEDFKSVEKTIINDPFIDIPTVTSLGNKHVSYKYLESRFIPKEYYEDLYYVEEFESFVNKLVPNKFDLKKITPSPRLVIPFRIKTNENNYIVQGFQGRTLDPKNKLRYITVNLNDNYPKCWGVHKINFNKRFYVLEGPFDAMFLKNAMAVAGSDLYTVIEQIHCVKENCVLIYDNEPRNKEIINKIEKGISLGYKLVIWPDDYEHKDVNKAIIEGIHISSIEKMLEKRVFSGLRAKMELNKWKKI